MGNIKRVAKMSGQILFGMADTLSSIWLMILRKPRFSQYSA